MIFVAEFVLKVSEGQAVINAFETAIEVRDFCRLRIRTGESP